MGGDHCSCQEPPYAPPCSYCTDGPDDVVALYFDAIDTIAYLEKRLADAGLRVALSDAQQAAIARRSQSGGRIAMLEPVFMDAARAATEEQ